MSQGMVEGRIRQPSYGLKIFKSQSTLMGFVRM